MTSYAVNCSMLFTELPLLRAPRRGRAAGFDAVEFWWPFDRPVPADAEVDAFVAAVRDAGVRLVGLNFFAGDMPAGDRGLVSWPGRARGVPGQHRRRGRASASRSGCRAFNALYGNRVDGRDARGAGRARRREPGARRRGRRPDRRHRAGRAGQRRRRATRCSPPPTRSPCSTGPPAGATTSRCWPTSTTWRSTATTSTRRSRGTPAGSGTSRSPTPPAGTSRAPASCRSTRYLAALERPGTTAGSAWSTSHATSGSRRLAASSWLPRVRPTLTAKEISA